MGKFKESPLGIALIVIAIVIPGTFQSAHISIRTNGKLLATASRTVTTKLPEFFYLNFVTKLHPAKFKGMPISNVNYHENVPGRLALIFNRN